MIGQDWRTIAKIYRATHPTTYFDTASLGLVADTQKALLHTSADMMLQDFYGLRNQLIQDLPFIRAEVAQTLTCPTEYIALVANLSEATYQVAQMLRPLQKVMLFKEDYPALNLPWQVLGYQVTWIEAESALTPERLRASLLKSEVKIIALSWVQYQTGYKIDLEGLAVICAELGILLVIDATQAWGVFTFEMEKYPSVIIAASAYKWATAGLGRGVLAIPPQVLHQFPPQLLSTKQLDAYQHYEDLSQIPLSMLAFELGHPSLLAIQMLRHAVQNLQSIGLTNIQTRVEALASTLIALLQTYGITPVANTDAVSGIVSIPYIPELYALLCQHHIAATERGGLIRFSVHFYNHEDDLAHLEEVLKIFRNKL